MLRVIGLALVVATGATKVAHAESRYYPPATNGIETSLHKVADNKRRSARDADRGGLSLQLGGGVAFAPPGHDNRGSGHLDLALAERQQRGREGRRVSRNGGAQGRSDGGLNLTTSNRPTVAYSVNDSLSLGLGYHYQSREDVDFRGAKTGGPDANFNSHVLMLEAHLSF